MNKTYITLTGLLLASFTVRSQSQMYIDFGPKIMAGPDVLYNSSAPFGANTRYTWDFSSLSFAGGAKFAFDFNTSVAVVVEGLYNQFTQSYVMTDDDPTGASKAVHWNKKLRYSSIDIPMMLRYNRENMKYFESGVVYSILQPVSESSGGPYDALAGNINASDYYASSKLAFVFGFGGYIWGQENAGVSGGLRFQYSFGDLVTASAKDKFSNAPIYALDNSISGPSVPVSIMYVLEFNYDMQFIFAKHSCSNRRKIIIGN